MAGKKSPPRAPADRRVEVDSTFTEHLQDLLDKGVSVESAVAAARDSLRGEHDEDLKKLPVAGEGRAGPMRILTVPMRGGQKWPRVYVYFELEKNSACMCGLTVEQAEPRKPT